MLEETVDIARRAFEAFNRDREAWLEMCADDCELHSLRTQLEGRPYRGREELRQFLVDTDEQWEYVRLEANEIRDAGEQVVALCDFKAKGRASGVELEFAVGMVMATREGKITYGRFYSDPDEALAAAGLSR
ncbi:MAG: nuclear transport factor 2 family protein [Solirubrobacterales bacterium]